MKSYVGLKSVEATPQTKDGKKGYKVVYKDGYESWSPKDVFEEAYHESGEMSFSEALYLLKQGKRIARKGWNGKGMFLFLAYGEDLTNSICTDNMPPCVDCIAMKTAQDTLVLGWLASQTDMLSDDWGVVE